MANENSSIFDGSAKMKKSIEQMNLMDDSKFSKLLNRVVEKTGSRNETIFSMDELSKLENVLELSIDDLKNLTETIEYIFLQAAYYMAKSNVLEDDLKKQNLNAAKIKIFSDQWSKSAKDIVDRLKNARVSKHFLSDLRWTIDVGISQMSKSKVKEPLAVYEFQLMNEETQKIDKLQTEFTKEELYAFFEKQLGTFSRLWYLYDAKWQDPNISGETIARIIRGEHKPIYYPTEEVGDCVVAINTRHVSLKNDSWRTEAFHHRRDYARTKYDIPLFKLHEIDPTKIVHLCVKNCIPMDGARRFEMARLFTFPDADIPVNFMRNVCDQIRGSRVIPRRLDELKADDIKNFPYLFKWPKELVLDDLDRDKFVRIVPPEELPKQEVRTGLKGSRNHYWFYIKTAEHEEVFYILSERLFSDQHLNWNTLDYEDLGIRPFQWDKDLDDNIKTTTSIFNNNEKEEYTYDLTIGLAEFSTFKKNDENSPSEDEECERDPETGEKIFIGHSEDVVSDDEGHSPTNTAKWIEDYLLNIETNFSSTSHQLLPTSSKDNNQEDELPFPLLSSNDNNDIKWFSDLLNDQDIYDPELVSNSATTMDSYMFGLPNMIPLSPTSSFRLTNTTYNPHRITTTTNDHEPLVYNYDNKRISIMESVDDDHLLTNDSLDLTNLSSIGSGILSEQLNSIDNMDSPMLSTSVKNSHLSLSIDYDTELSSNDYTRQFHSLDHDSTTNDSEMTLDESSNDHQHIETKTEPFDEIPVLSTQESIDRRMLHVFRTSTRSKRQRDEETLRRYNIQMSLDEITQLSTENYNKKVTEMIFTNEQLHIIKDIRRRGKNKVAAQNCRKRKAVNVESLLEEVDELKRVKMLLEEKRKSLEEQITYTKIEYENLHKLYLPSKKMPPLAILVK
ncbi:unnamed protein product [Didymodactylos carnosus]|nr:unnamed protein product [Didymodactylos carnosus]CAF3673668.1 unnamed protein product [Didymodactylos carnosus]